MQSLTSVAGFLIFFGLVSLSLGMPLESQHITGAHVRNGVAYKILSASDHQVLTVENEVHVNGNPVIALPWEKNKLENQAFVAEELETPGVFYFASIADRSYALDSSRNPNKLGHLIVYKKNTPKNQHWTIEPSAEGSFDFYIRNVYDTKVLELGSDGNKVYTNIKNKANVNQLWVFSEVPQLD